MNCLIFLAFSLCPNTFYSFSLISFIVRCGLVGVTKNFIYFFSSSVISHSSDTPFSFSFLIANSMECRSFFSLCKWRVVCCNGTESATCCRDISPAPLSIILSEIHQFVLSIFYWPTVLLILRNMSWIYLLSLSALNTE